MKNRLIALQDQLSSSYWFIPATMAVLAAGLSILTIKLDETVGRELAWVIGLIYVDSPEGARAVLSTVASSMITVAGVVFSLTMVVLSLTSQQYGPLVLTHFMRDRGNQFVLGIFTATFIYCLLVLRTIRGVENSIFVPHISVLVGLGLAIASLAVLIYFIHHVSKSIQSTNIIARISDELLDAIDDRFPAKIGSEPDRPMTVPNHQDVLQRFEYAASAIQTPVGGYLQMVDDERLFEVAQEQDVIVQLIARPGQFLHKGQPLARVLPRQPNGDTRRTIQDAFIFGSRRTRTQDVEFVFMQLSAVAVRALSPAINDPYTALMCIDRLGEALCRLLNREPPSMYRYDDEGRLRLIANPVTFADVFHAAFDSIRHYGHSDLNVDSRLLSVITALVNCADAEEHLQLLQRYAELIHRESREYLSSEADRQQIDDVYATTLRAFQFRQEERIA
ncbi:MAG: DUF2254 domain-containing protein [Chloroflexi bacterium]|nr:DUF2254 domain-containing protein [Chloroflexota bacterium]